MRSTITTILFSVILTLTANVAVAQPQLMMTKVTVKDPVAAHKEAVNFLVPMGWRVSGGMKWYVNSAHQACLQVKINNPNGLEQVETLPYNQCTWLTNPVFPMRIGSSYMGMNVRPPIEDPAEVVRQIALPALRPGARIVGRQDLPEIARALSAANGGIHVRSSKIRIEYTVNRQAVEEDIYLSIKLASANLGVNNCISYQWGPAWPPFALRAPKGRLDAVSPLLLAIVSSMQFDQQWLGEYVYVCQLFQQRLGNGIANARAISDTVTRNSQQISKLYSDAYWNRQAVQDRTARNFSNYIRGVQPYVSPYQNGSINLPSGYSNVWASPNGGYIFSNNVNFNPNNGGHQNWSLLRPQ